MTSAIIQERLLSYQCQNILEQENALKEIAQEIALMGLSRAEFFKIAAFQGGTCLRILYNLNRFSEDLDFVLERPDKAFNWDKYVQYMQEEFNTHGFVLEVKKRQTLDNPIQTIFLKTNSEGGLLIIKDNRTNQPKLKIKLEIDTNPPEGSHYEIKYLDFPLPYSIKTHDLPSLFAGKCHALLCCEYAKGRDWYDFIWYVSKNTSINFTLLNNAIAQSGPWQANSPTITKEWFLKEMGIKITDMDWELAKNDVARFLKPQELSTLTLWSKEFFLSRLEKLANYLI